MRRLHGVLAVILLVGVLAHPVGPVQLNYVTSDSMTPTLGVDDGFLVTATGQVQPGDIITFHSAKHDDLVTHRVVRETDAGFITKGDNNPTIDQKSGYTAVKQREIVGEVLTVAGTPIILPNLGVAVTLIHDYWRLVGGAFILIILFTGGKSRRTRVRSFLTPGNLVRAALLSALLFGTAGFYLGASVSHVSFVAAEQAGGGRLVEVGEPAVRSFTADTSNGIIAVTGVATTGAAVIDRTRNTSEIRVTIRVPASETTGEVPITVTVYHYLGIVPKPIAVKLQAIHPILVIGTSIALAISPLYLLYRLFVDRKRPIRLKKYRHMKQLLRNDP